MIFNSLIYLYIFLPISVLGYFVIAKFFSQKTRNVWLILVSLFFYGFWNPVYIPLLLGSMFSNFYFGLCLSKKTLPFNISRRLFLTIGITLNLVLIGIFKYADFFITNVNWVLGKEIPLAHLVLPLAISFFTFQQIAFLVDSYKGLTKEYSLVNYALFVTFFPQLIAGPIVHHKEMIPQFKKPENGLINYRNLSLGLFIIFMGLVKKVGIADTFAEWANAGYAHEGTLTFFDAWVTSLSYTFQLYFDFSGYTDMAIGAALLFNIVLPINFNSPYKATNIQNFWDRWHITMTSWFRDYLYFPLAWSWRNWGRLGSHLALFITFVIIGLWHGGVWTFIGLGALHGIAMTTHRLWKEYAKIQMPAPVGWFLTFNFVNIAWVLFRSNDFAQAWNVIKSMFGINGLGPTTVLFLQKELFVVARLDLPIPEFFQREAVVWIILFLFVVLALKNSNQIMEKYSPTILYICFAIALYGIGTMSLGGFSEFLYFNF